MTRQQDNDGAGFYGSLSPAPFALTLHSLFSVHRGLEPWLTLEPKGTCSARANRETEHSQSSIALVQTSVCRVHMLLKNFSLSISWPCGKIMCRPFRLSLLLRAHDGYFMVDGSTHLRGCSLFSLPTTIRVLQRSRFDMMSPRFDFRWHWNWSKGLAPSHPGQQSRVTGPWLHQRCMTRLSLSKTADLSSACKNVCQVHSQTSSLSSAARNTLGKIMAIGKQTLCRVLKKTLSKLRKNTRQQTAMWTSVS